MGKIKRYKNSVERFLSGEKGQRFFNFAYSIGAAIVIWGALFKILHLPGGQLPDEPIFAESPDEPICAE